jgi:DNA-binding Lrp family transcriptional regulator
MITGGRPGATSRLTCVFEASWTLADSPVGTMHGAPTETSPSRSGSPPLPLEQTRSLRQRGVIRGTVLDLNLAAVGRGVQALIAIRIRPPSRRNIEGFRNWIAQLPETIGVFVVSGAEDFLVHIAVRDNQDLYAFVIDRLTERPEVADVRTSVVYEHLHKTQITPNT